MEKASDRLRMLKTKRVQRKMKEKLTIRKKENGGRSLSERNRPLFNETQNGFAKNN